MTFIEKARRIANDTKFKEKIGDALEDAGNAFLGNPVSAAKFIKFLLESPIMIRERLFWNKFSLFLEEIYSDENNKVKMIAKPKCRKREVISPQIDLRPHTASDEDVQQMLNNIFDK